MSDMIPLNDLAQEANDNHEQVISNAKKAISAAMAAGASLLRAKEQVPHGEWLAWQKTNLTYSQQTASRYMTIAANYSSMSNLKDAKDINDALRMISERKAEENPEHVPRPERKTDRVQVSKPNSPDDSSEGVRTDTDANAVPAEPRTNTKHSKATAKARESDRPASPVVTPEIVDEPETQKTVHEMLAEESAEVRLKFAIREVSQVLTKIAAESERKSAAKQLRKLADELDPPKKFSPPDLNDVRAYCLERKNKVDPEAFHAHYSANGWKQANGNKLADWKAAIITWEKRDDSGNRNGNGSNRITTGRVKPAPVDESKIEYV